METIFQKRLKYLRIYYNVSQKKLADGLNITTKVISDYELGKVEPNCKAIVDIAHFFNVSTDYLLPSRLSPVPPPLPVHRQIPPRPGGAVPAAAADRRAPPPCPLLRRLRVPLHPAGRPPPGLRLRPGGGAGPLPHPLLRLFYGTG